MTQSVKADVLKGVRPSGATFEYSFKAPMGPNEANFMGVATRCAVFFQSRTISAGYSIQSHFTRSHQVGFIQSLVSELRRTVHGLNKTAKPTRHATTAAFRVHAGPPAPVIVLIRVPNLVHSESARACACVISPLPSISLSRSLLFPSLPLSLAPPSLLFSRCHCVLSLSLSLSLALSLSPLSLRS